ncbi:hypothetical protein [Streptomyces sp. NPDC090131]|uniref:hypothetical protein n=1 Tax=Streptomyces sp. NPDC090131 TaxID=3365954 RepID=UPI00382C3106
MALVRLEAPDELLPLIDEIHEQATLLNRLVTGASSRHDRAAVVTTCPRPS